MKTVMIFDQCEANLSFIVLDGDYSRLDGIYINSMDSDEDLTDELTDLLYDADGKFKVARLDKFPTQEVVDGALVIITGFLP